MITTIQFGDEAEQYQVAPVLRPGNAKGSLGAIGILQRLLPRLRKTFPFATIYVCLDGAFATPGCSIGLKRRISFTSSTWAKTAS